MDILGLKKIYLLFIVICIFPCGLLAYEMEDCVVCHSDNPGEEIPQISVVDYEASIHGILTCENCHSYIDEAHEGGEVAGKVDCNKCHKQENLHGISAGRDNRPECQSCHTKHEIIPAFMENSSVNETRFKDTCVKCHPAEWGEQGYLWWFTSVRIRSHKKQDFNKDFNETNCTGCHQGGAIHGKHEVINDDRCYQCHLNNNQNGLMGKFHTGRNSGGFILILSIMSQALILIILGFVIRFFISGSRENP
ncbi:hypothetical protein ACFL1N_07745 [Thermodesulfobacteriota bacterium]